MHIKKEEKNMRSCRHFLRMAGAGGLALQFGGLRGQGQTAEKLGMKITRIRTYKFLCQPARKCVIPKARNSCPVGRNPGSF